jgi:hypothetical protein
VNREHITAIEGLSAYALSQNVAKLQCVEGVDKAVLRALSDHYPNVWADVDTLAIESGWHVRAVQRAMRRLELQNWINGVRPLKDRVGGQGQSEQYVINDRKIIDALAMQRLEDAIQTGKMPTRDAGLGDINPAPETGLVKNTPHERRVNPARGTQTPHERRVNPAPDAQEPTIEPTKEPTTNQPPKDWMGGLQELHGQSQVMIPSGLNGKNIESILDRIKADGWSLVAKSFELCLSERPWDGLTKSNVAQWYLKEYPQWIARAKAQEPEVDLTAFKAQLARDNEAYRRAIMSEPKPVLAMPGIN